MRALPRAPSPARVAARASAGRGEDIERPEPLAREPWGGRELVGEDLPQLVQASAAARLHRLPDGVVGVRIPALGIVEDADAGVAVRADVDEAADLLRAPLRIARQQGAFGMDQAEVDQDRGAF